MIRQSHAHEREAIVAKAIQGMVSELRLIEPADYIAFIRLEHFSAVSDLVDSAAELFFMPGTIRLGHGGEARVDWREPPKIALDLELRPQGATVYFTLELGADHAGVEVNYVAFDAPADDPMENTARLERALDRVMLQPRHQAA